MSTSLRRQNRSLPTAVNSPASSPSATIARKTSGSARHAKHSRSDAPRSPERTAPPPIVPSRTFSADSTRSSAAWSTTSTLGDARETRPHAHCSLQLTGRCVCTSGFTSAQEANESARNTVLKDASDPTAPAAAAATAEGDQPVRAERVFHYYTLPNGAYREPKMDSIAAADTASPSTTHPAPQPAPGSNTKHKHPSRTPSHSRRKEQTSQEKTRRSQTPQSSEPAASRQSPQTSTRQPATTRKPPPSAPSPKPSITPSSPNPQEFTRRRDPSPLRKRDPSPLRHTGSLKREHPQRPPRATPPPTGALRGGPGQTTATTSPTTRKMKHASAPLPMLQAAEADPATKANVHRSNTLPHQRDGPQRVFNYYTLPDGGYRTPTRASTLTRHEPPVSSPAVAAAQERTGYYITHEPPVHGRGRGHARSSSVPLATAAVPAPAPVGAAPSSRPKLSLKPPGPEATAGYPDTDDEEEKEREGDEGSTDSSTRARRVPQPRDRSPYPVNHRSLPVTTTTTPVSEAPTAAPTALTGEGDEGRVESWVPPIVLPRGSGETPPGILLNRIPVAPRAIDYGFVPPARGGARGHMLGVKTRRRARSASAGSATAVEDVLGEEGHSHGKRAWVRVVGKVRAALDKVLPEGP